jgi:peptide/nickel transport system permease protein
VFTRCLYGARLSLTVGSLVVLVSLLPGTVLGVVAGYVRRLDGLLMRLTDAMMAFPDILTRRGRC